MVFQLSLLVLTTIFSPSLPGLKKAPARGKVGDGGMELCFLTPQPVIWGQFKSIRQILLGPVLTLEVRLTRAVVLNEE